MNDSGSFQLRKFFWDFFDHVFLLIVINILYNLILFPFYRCLFLMAPASQSTPLLWGTLALIYLVLISPVFVPLYRLVFRISRQDDPTIGEFFSEFRSIPFLKAWKIHGLFGFLMLLWIFAFNFYFHMVSRHPILLGLILILFFLLLFFLCWFQITLIRYFSEDLSWKDVFSQAALVVEYFTFLLPWEFFWLTIFVLSVVTVWGLILVVPSVVLIFFGAFCERVHLDYDLKMKAFQEASEKKVPFLPAYKRHLAQFYRSWYGPADRYKRSWIHLIKPWEHHQ